MNAPVLFCHFISHVHKRVEGSWARCSDQEALPRRARGSCSSATTLLPAHTLPWCDYCTGVAKQRLIPFCIPERCRNTLLRAFFTDQKDRWPFSSAHRRTLCLKPAPPPSGSRMPPYPRTPFLCPEKKCVYYGLKPIVYLDGSKAA